MATYLKRSSKLFERLASSSVSSGSADSVSAASSSSSSSGSSSEQSLRDLICPVCRALLREPVTLPCSHNLCLGCLRASLEQLDKTSSSGTSSGNVNLLTCPLCRQKLGSWLRSRRKPESLVNLELWKFIRQRYPENSDQAAAAGPLLIEAAAAAAAAAATRGNDAHRHPEFLQEAMRRQREQERLANEAILLRKIQEEKHQKLVQLAQEQLLAKTLAKNDVMGQHKSKLDIYHSKLATNQKILSRSKDVIDMKKQNVVLASKIRSDRYISGVKSNSTIGQKDPTESFRSQKSVPIHNAVTRVVTHQNRLNQLNNSAYSGTGELGSTSSKIFGLQTKEELHVPSDVISNKKKKLGVEVCVTNVEGEERIGSAESAGSHDSINQEIHHFKPIKALPRTPLRITLDGRQIDPKLIRVLPILKRVSNAVPKAPLPTHPKKVFGCSWSAFKRIIKHQVQFKDFPDSNQSETKKTDKRSESIRNVSKSSKAATQDQLNESSVEGSFDTNKNYTKNLSKTLNGTKVNKKFSLNEQTMSSSSSVKQQAKRAPRVRNGQLPSKHKLPVKQKVIEVVDIDDDDDDIHYKGKDGDDSNSEQVTSTHVSPPKAVSITPKDQDRPVSPFLEIVENIAERIKRRNTSRAISNTENIQSAINQDTAGKSKKAASKKSSSTVNNQKAKKPSSPARPKVRTKIEKVTTLTSQIKRLAARSSKKPRYTEDSESEEEYFERRRLEEQLKLEAAEAAELLRSFAETDTPQKTSKKPARKPAKSKKSKQSKKNISASVKKEDSQMNDFEATIEESVPVRNSSKDRAAKRLATKVAEASESDEDMPLSPPKKSSKDRTAKRLVNKVIEGSENDEEDTPLSPPKKSSKDRTAKRLVNKVIEASESDEEDMPLSLPKKSSKDRAAKRLLNKVIEASESDEEDIPLSLPKKSSRDRAAKRLVNKVIEASESDEEDMPLSLSKKSSKDRAAKRLVNKVIEASESDEEDIPLSLVEKSSKGRAAKRPINKVIEASESDEEDMPLSPPKKPRRTNTSNTKQKQNKKKANPVKKTKKTVIDEETMIREQERLEQLAIQERKDLELALKLQQQFNAMERVAGRTRRGVAARPPSPVINDTVQEKSQKKTVK